MKRLVTFLLICVLLVPLLVKGAIWFQVYNQLRDARKAFEPYGLIDWGGIFSTIDGEIGVNELSITPFQLKDTLVIDKLALDFQSLEGLLKAAIPLVEGRYPDSLSVAIIDARIALSDTSLGFLKPENDRLSDISSSRVYACGDVDALTGRELKAMGYESLDYNGHINYAFEPQSSQLQVESEFEAAGMGRAKLNAQFYYSVPYVSAKQVFSAATTLDSVSVTIKDVGYYRRLAFLCGRLNNLSQSEYIQAALDEWNQNLQQAGVQMDRAFLTALNDYMAHGAELTIALNPKRGLSNALASAKTDDGTISGPEKLLAAFNPTFALGRAEPKPLRLRFDQSKLDRALMDQAELDRRDEAELARQNAKPTIKRERRYVAINIGRFDQYAGEVVRVTGDNGKVYEGELTQVQEDKILVTSALGSGTFSFPIRLENIQSAEVLQIVEIVVPPVLPTVSPQ